MTSHDNHAFAIFCFAIAWLVETRQVQDVWASTGVRMSITAFSH